MNTVFPKRGEIWSLKHIKAEPNAPAPLFLLDRNPAKQLVGYYLFDQGGLACQRDLRLSDDPDWLDGESWCAVMDGMVIPPAVLSMRVDQLSLDLMDQIAAFRDGQTVSLVQGVPLMTELGDNRGRLRGQMLKSAARWTKQPALARAKTTLTLIAQKSGKLLGFSGESSLPTDALGSHAGLSAGLVPGSALGNLVGAFRSLVNGQDRPSVERFEFTVDEYDVGVIAQHLDGQWQLTIEVEANSVQLLPPSGAQPTIELEAMGRGWLMPDLSRLESGVHNFKIEGKKGPAEFSLDLREG